MTFDLKKKDIIIIILVFSFLTALSILIFFAFFKKSENTASIVKNNYNTFESSYVTNDMQAYNYLSAYYNLLYWDIDKAYELLDNSSDYNNKDDFKNYISTLNISSSVIKKFRYYEKGGYDYYDIYDVNNNKFIFKINGVMNYTVIIKK